MSARASTLRPGGVPGVRVDAARTPLGLDLPELWSHRELVYFFVWRDLKVRYRQSLIGVGWAVIQPVMMMVVFSLLFGRLARLPSDGVPHPVFYFSGLLPWLYFANALTQATNSVVGQQALIRKVYFPRLILPMAAVASGLVDLSIALVVLLALALAYGVVPGPAVLALPAFVALASLTAFAVGLWLSALNAVYRDVRHAVPFLVQLWMFASPVVYPSSLVPEPWRWLYRLNPLAVVVEGFRWALTGRGQPPDLPAAVAVAGVLGLLLGGLGYFRRVEGTVADVV